jgi:bacterioferritin-associated ferredoxin
MLPDAPCVVLHITDVPVSQAVASHAVTPIDIEAELKLSPDCTPCTTTLADPVPALFVRRDELRIDVSSDRRLVAELTSEPVVSSVRLLP